MAYEVDEILDSIVTDGQERFVIKWIGYPISSSTIQPYSDLHCDDVLSRFRQTRQLEGRIIGFVEKFLISDGLHTIYKVAHECGRMGYKLEQNLDLTRLFPPHRIQKVALLPSNQRFDLDLEMPEIIDFGGILFEEEDEDDSVLYFGYLITNPENVFSKVDGGLAIEPNSKIQFVGPYNDKHTYHIKIINNSAHRIGWTIKTTNTKRLGVDPACGVLDSKEATWTIISCSSFAYGREDTNNDRITIEWTNTPDGAAKQFRAIWFQNGGIVQRKNLSIEYKP